MSLNKIFSIGIVFVLLLVNCSKAPVYPNEPQITFKSMTKNRMLQSLGNKYRDSVVLTIGFTDGDGDLGALDNQTTKPTDAMVIDLQRGDTTDPYTLPYIGNKGATKGINGEMAFIIYTSCCNVPDAIQCLEKSVAYPLDTLFYEIILKDRAGNLSNRLKLPPIELICNQ